MKIDRKMMIKIAIAGLIVMLVFLISKWNGKCKCDAKSKVTSYGTMKPLPQGITLTAVPVNDVYFDEYDPSTEDAMVEDDIITQEKAVETFADFVPDYTEREKYVDARDSFAHPEFNGMLM
jgi:hypothetical protein